MAKSTLALTKEDFESKSFKTAPGGRYTAKVTRKNTKIKAGASGDILQIGGIITKGPHKGTTFFDNIAAHVGWKVAQVLRALGISFDGAKKFRTLQDLLKAVVEQELQVILREKTFGGQKRNEVVQWLPINAAADEDDEEESDEDEEDEEADDEESDDETEEEDDDAADEEADADEDEEDEEDEEDADDDDEDEDEDDSEEQDDSEEEEDEEEEDDKPAKKKAVKKSVPAKKAAVKKTAKKR